MFRRALPKENVPQAPSGVAGVHSNSTPPNYGSPVTVAATPAYAPVSSEAGGASPGLNAIEIAEESSFGSPHDRRAAKIAVETIVLAIRT